MLKIQLWNIGWGGDLSPHLRLAVFHETNMLRSIAIARRLTRL